MKPHPDFADNPLPRSANLGSFNLSVLSPRDVEEDYAVVSESIDVLEGLFGDNWPNGLTLDENLQDLTRHAQEFDVQYAFAWIIRSTDGRYLGCAYLKPTPGEFREGQVFTWIRLCKDRLDILNEFNAAFLDWLNCHLPEGFSLSWTSNDKISRSNG